MEIRKRYTITAAGVALALAVTGCSSEAPEDHSDHEATTTTVEDHGEDHGDHEALQALMRKAMLRMQEAADASR